MFAVDSGSTAMRRQFIQKQGLKGKVRAVGLGRRTAGRPAAHRRRARCSFTIDQQAYLQGFLPIMQLYLYNVVAER